MSPLPQSQIEQELAQFNDGTPLDVDVAHAVIDKLCAQLILGAVKGKPHYKSMCRELLAIGEPSFTLNACLQLASSDAGFLWRFQLAIEDGAKKIWFGSDQNDETSEHHEI